MTTKAMTKKKAEGNGHVSLAPRPQPLASHDDGDLLREETGTIDADKIDPSPWQRRKDFSGIEDLAQSLKSLGLRQAILVRESPTRPGRYELLAGERRLRAAKHLGWDQIRASVQEATDAEAREIVLVENLQRKDLNAIEEAQQWAELLGKAEGGGGKAEGPTQTELAKRLGVTQGHISNRLRLLRLPKEFQEAVISGEMAASTARDLVRIADLPAVCGELISRFKKRGPWAKSLSLGAWLSDPDQDRLSYSIDQATRSMEDKVYDRSAGRHVTVFTPTPEQSQELDIREFPDQYNRGNTKRRAVNVKLWEKLQAEHLAKQRMKVDRKAEGKKKTEPKPLTAAEQKQQQAAERERKRKTAEQLARRRKTLAVHRLRCLIAEAILHPATSDEMLLELCVLAALKGWSSGYAADHAQRAVAKIKQQPIRRRAAVLLAEVFWKSQQNAPCEIVYEGRVEHVAKFLGVDAAGRWRNEQMGSLTEAWWNAHDTDTLRGLCKTYGLRPGANYAAMKKSECIKNWPRKSGRGKVEGGRPRPAGTSNWPRTSTTATRKTDCCKQDPLRLSAKKERTMQWILTKQLAYIAQTASFVTQTVATPIPVFPFPGLRVGAMVVRRVYVNQGQVDGEIEVEYQPVSKEQARILENNGWSREDVA